MKNIVKVMAFVAIVPMFSSCGQYNQIEENDEAVNQAWANVETQYQRRVDLITNLVETVKGAANFEKEVFIGVSEARAGIVKPSPEMLKDKAQLAEFYKSQANLQKQAGMMFNIAVERYPDLKATQAFRDFMAEQSGTENRVANARKVYNEAVNTHNTYIRKIPARWINSAFNKIEKREPFAADPGSEKAPTVDFGE